MCESPRIKNKCSCNLWHSLSHAWKSCARSCVWTQWARVYTEHYEFLARCVKLVHVISLFPVRHFCSALYCFLHKDRPCLEGTTYLGRQLSTHQQKVTFVSGNKRSRCCRVRPCYSWCLAKIDAGHIRRACACTSYLKVAMSLLTLLGTGLGVEDADLPTRKDEYEFLDSISIILGQYVFDQVRCETLKWSLNQFPTCTSL